jgi:hypothetical protein
MRAAWNFKKEGKMDILYIVAIVLLLLWFAGILTSTMGGLIHILLMIALLVILLRVIRGRKVFN